MLLLAISLFFLKSSVRRIIILLQFSIPTLVSGRQVYAKHISLLALYPPLCFKERTLPLSVSPLLFSKESIETQLITFLR